MKAHHVKAAVRAAVTEMASAAQVNATKTYVAAETAESFVPRLPHALVDLFLIDPPYYGITKDSWDNQWPDAAAYSRWLARLLDVARLKVKPTGSLIVFGGIGKHGEHPLFDVIRGAEAAGWHYRNWITWKKRRAYGKSHDYLFTREEILWYSASPLKGGCTFNIPLLAEKRGYAGYNPKYPAKSEFKRVSNVWDDITELLKTERSAQKPLLLLERLIETHSNPGDLVVDFFAGYGSTGIVALKLNRRFLGCEAIEADAKKANARCVGMVSQRIGKCSFCDGTGVKANQVRESDVDADCGYCNGTGRPPPTRSQK